MRYPRHCCTDCSNDKHEPLCGYYTMLDNEPLFRFLKFSISERCQKCYDTLDPLVILAHTEL